MGEDETKTDVFHLPPLPEVLPEEPEYAWSRKWVIINTGATIGGALTGIVALVVAVVALTS